LASVMSMAAKRAVLEDVGVIGAPPTAAIRESGARVSLWRAPLDISAPALRSLTGSLSFDERRRADRFHRPLDRARFVAARGWLRCLLGTELDCAPGDLRIATGDNGKPRLEGSDLRFSAARSGGIALYATSWLVEVGVDVEAIEANADLDGIAARFFSPSERQALASVRPAQRLAAFIQCWACKEAYVKGIGAGLSFPLDTVDAWLAGGRPAHVSGWSVHQVDLAPGFAAAVAVSGADSGEWTPSVPRKLAAPGPAPDSIATKSTPIR
jgi:4'-phosphopantetheinyl transferase